MFQPAADLMAKELNRLLTVWQDHTEDPAFGCSADFDDSVCFHSDLHGDVLGSVPLPSESNDEVLPVFSPVLLPLFVRPFSFHIRSPG